MSSLQKKETLLIVDDSKFQRVVIRQSLGEYFNFAEAVSGEECLTIMEKESDAIDLVLLDLVMPGIDGFEVLRRRQNMEGFKDTPVIVLTNTESVSSQSEAFALGADEFIIKPVDTRIALTRINNTLGVKRRLQNSRDEQKAWKTKSQIDEMTSLFNKMTVEKLITKTLTEHENGLHGIDDCSAIGPGTQRMLAISVCQRIVAGVRQAIFTLSGSTAIDKHILILNLADGGCLKEAEYTFLPIA